MFWYCFFIFFIHFFYASDLLVPKDFLVLDILHNGKPVLIKDYQLKTGVPSYPIIVLPYQEQEIITNKKIKQIAKIPYSIKDDTDDNYLAIKRNGVFTGYGFKRFNREISVLLLYIALLKKEYNQKEIFVIPHHLHTQIYSNAKFKNIFQRYGFFITKKSLTLVEQALSKISKPIETPKRNTCISVINRYIHLHRATPFKLLMKQYNFYQASLLKNYTKDPTQPIILKPAKIFEKKYLCPSEIYILGKQPIMTEYCQKNDFALFKINNLLNIPILLEDLELIDLFFQIRYAQITGNNALSTICIIEKKFDILQSNKLFCKFLSLFNIFCSGAKTVNTCK